MRSFTASIVACVADGTKPRAGYFDSGFDVFYKIKKKCESSCPLTREITSANICSSSFNKWHYLRSLFSYPVATTLSSQDFQFNKNEPFFPFHSRYLFEIFVQLFGLKIRSIYCGSFGVTSRMTYLRKICCNLLFIKVTFRNFLSVWRFAFSSLTYFLLSCWEIGPGFATLVNCYSQDFPRFSVD